jgi:hypothetical protein
LASVRLAPAGGHVTFESFRQTSEVDSMKKIAVLSALVLSCAGVAAAHSMLSSEARSMHATRPAVDDPPPEPFECPLCGGNPTVHVRRMQLIEALQGDFMIEALRW